MQRTKGSICKTLEDGRKLSGLDFEFQQDGTILARSKKSDSETTVTVTVT